MVRVLYRSKVSYNFPGYHRWNPYYDALETIRQEVGHYDTDMVARIRWDDRETRWWL